MATLFDAWNACIPRIDEHGDPQFCFDFGVNEEEVIFFFMLSARVTEVITGLEWELNVNGDIYDVPNVSPNEIREVIDNIDYKFGYEYDIFHIELNHNGHTLSVPTLHWIDLETGYIQMFEPGRGLKKLRQVRPARGSAPTANSNVIVVNQDGNGNLTSDIAKTVSGIGSVAMLVKTILTL